MKTQKDMEEVDSGQRSLQVMREAQRRQLARPACNQETLWQPEDFTSGPQEEETEKPEHV